jgi:hypothetical protein
MSISSYGDGGVYHRGLKIVDKTFPRSHTKVKPNPHAFQGTTKEILKLGAKSLGAYFGIPASYAALPVTALFSNFGMEGEKKLNPDRHARLLGYKSKADQELKIKEYLKSQQLKIKK